MFDALTARHLFARFQECEVRRDWLAFAALFAEDGTMEFPFVPPETASRCEGREAIGARARLAWGQPSFLPEAFCSVVVEEGADPSVLFAEYEVRGTVASTSEPLQIPAAIVLRTRDGLIASMREYLDPIALAKAAGRGPALAASDASQALVRRYFEMWNTGDAAEADAVLGRTYLDHAHPGVLGPAAVRSLVRRFRSESPGARMTIDIATFDAEYVVVRRAIRWTAHGKREPCGIALFRIADGQLAEQWSWSPASQRASGTSPREWPIA